MPGAVIIIIALAVFPIIALMGTAVLAVVLGMVLNKDAEIRGEGSELLDLNV